MSFPGKLAVFRRSDRTGRLALGFTSEIITLYARRNDDWTEVAQADITARNFAEQIEALRAEAGARDRSNAPIMIWLPPEQVIERHYTLAAISDDARRTEATRRIAGETPHAMDELAVAIASESRFEPVKVLAVLLQTMTEARSHVAGWGFVPGRISTQVGMRGFAPPGPVFEFPRSIAGKAGRTVRRAAVAAVAVAAVGGGAFGAYRLVEPMLDSPAAIGPKGPAPSSYAVFMDPPPGPQIPLGDVEKTVVTHLDLPRMRARAKTLAPSAGTASRALLRKADTPRELQAPDSGGPLTVSNAPDVPKIVTIGRAAPSPVDMDKMVIAAIIPIAPISDLVGRSAPEPVSGNTETDAAAPDPNELRRADTPTAGAGADVGTDVELDPPIIVAAAETPAETPPADATEFAPEKVTVLPRPRPGSVATDDPIDVALTPPRPRPAALAGTSAPATSDPAAGTDTAAATDPAPKPDATADATSTAAADDVETTETAATATTGTADTSDDGSATGAYVAMTSRFGPPPARPGSTPARAAPPVEVKTVANDDADESGTETVTASGDAAETETAATDETGAVDETTATGAEAGDGTESAGAEAAPAAIVAMTSRYGPPPARPDERVADEKTPAPVSAEAEVDEATPGAPTDAATGETDETTETTVADGTAAPVSDETENGGADEADGSYVAMTSRFGPPPLRPGTRVARAPVPVDDPEPATDREAPATETVTGKIEVAAGEPGKAPDASADETEEAPAYVAMTSRFGPPPLRPGGATSAGSLTTTVSSAVEEADRAVTDTALALPAPRPESLVRLAPAAPADPRPGRPATTAGIASDMIRNDSVPGASPDDGGSTAGVPVAALTIPTGRPADLALSGAPKRAETPVSPKDRERLALAPATTELRAKPDDSGAAATKAPEPSKRPRTLEFHARRAPARTRTPLSVYLPRSVGDAAKRSGLALNQTNLIGVIEAKNGRQALVRLPDGGFRKISRGDSIEGWRVSAVNRESVRLTRRGEKRTLLLVTP